MKIICDACNSEFDIKTAEKVHLQNGVDFLYSCPCGGETWILVESLDEERSKND